MKSLSAPRSKEFGEQAQENRINRTIKGLKKKHKIIPKYERKHTQKELIRHELLTR